MNTECSSAASLHCPSELNDALKDVKSHSLFNSRLQATADRTRDLLFAVHENVGIDLWAIA